MFLRSEKKLLGSSHSTLLKRNGIDPRLDGITFSIFLPTESASLSRPFSLEEIDVVVANCYGNKSLGPDVFNFAFTKTLWDMMRPEVGTFF